MEALKVTHKLTLTDNMAVVKASIAATIAKYDVVVVEDQLSEAKELMAIFNKNKKEFSAQCKAFIDEVSGPIAEFKKSQKEIEQMFDDGRAKIADQVKKFEEAKLEGIAVVVKAYRNMACEAAGISTQAVTVDDLIMLSSVTVSKKGSSLTKAVREAIESRAKAVEIEILKARLAAEEKAKEDAKIAEEARLKAEVEARDREAEIVARMERQRVEELAAQQAKHDASMEEVQQPKPIEAEVIKPPAGKVRATLVFEFEIKGNPKTEAIIERIQAQISEGFREYLVKVEVDR